MDTGVRPGSYWSRQKDPAIRTSAPLGSGRSAIRTVLAIAAAAIAIGSLSIPQVAAAQPGPPGERSYGTGDICRQARNDAATRGTVVGAILGGVLGAGVAGRHNRAAGAVVGGTAGAVAGHEIGKNSVKCLSYPRRFRYHRSNCRWVEDPDEAGHQFEVCKDSDGVWRPSGRD